MYESAAAAGAAVPRALLRRERVVGVGGMSMGLGRSWDAGPVTPSW
jgi:hypothetical protein